MDDKLLKLKEELLATHEAALELQAVADHENRELTPDESQRVEQLFADYDKLTANIERREVMLAHAKRLSDSARKSPPDSSEPHSGLVAGVAASDTDIRKAHIEVQSHGFERDPKRGFKNFGDFAARVMVAGINGGQIDPRLISAAPSTYGSEGVGADGGYAVPPDFRQTIEKLVMGEDSLLARTRQIQTNSNNLSLPTIEDTPWSASGVQAYWEAEAAQMSQSKPALKKINLELNKLTALVGVTDELREDAAALNSLLPTLAGEAITNAVNNSIVSGTGAGTPLGILNAASTVSVAKESGQAADTVVYGNIILMWSRLYAPYRQNAVWLIHQDVEPQLQQMYLPTGSTGVAAYMPPGGLSTGPYATIMGRPVIPIQACETVGDQGDIILWAPDRYLTAVKSGGVSSEMSIHLWFDYNVTAFRFILRVAGQPLLSAAISPRDGTNTLSSQVVLDARA